MSAAQRVPFFANCPICGSSERAPVVEFPELTFTRCRGCGLIYKHEQVANLGSGYEESFFLAGDAKYLRRWAHRVRKCRRQVDACLEYAPQAKTLLDVGCSYGYVLQAAKDAGL